MYEVVIYTLRSRALDGSELVGCLDRFQTTFSDCVEEYERASDTESKTYSLRLSTLPALDSFARVSKAYGITLITGTDNPEEDDTFLVCTRMTHAMSVSHSWTTYHVANSSEAMSRGEKDLSIFAGRRKEGYFCGIKLFRPSPAADDPIRRAAVFKDAIDELGLTNHITTFLEDGVLRMKAQEPWNLAYPGARLDGGDPCGFFACGFIDLEEALAAGQKLVARLAKKTLGVRFVTRLPPDGYNVVYKRLNDLRLAWDIDVMGSLTPEALNILNGCDPPKNPPSRIPAFNWYFSGTDLAAYGSVVIENGQRYLEISTDNAPLEMLQEWVAFLPDAEFQPVDS